MPTTDLLAALARSATNYHRGIYCPAVLWRDVADQLAGQDARALLSALPADLQAVLRNCYRERALSL